MNKRDLLLLSAAVLISGCLSKAPEGLGPSQPAATTVAMDFYHRPLPEIPLPNDIATRHDPTSATGRRINASMVAATDFERTARERIDQLDGWGVYAPITIPFTRPIDVLSVRDRHCVYEPRLPSPVGFEEPDEGAEICAFDADQSDDAVYLVNVDRTSGEFGRIHHLDVGHGSYPVVLEDLDGYWDNDTRDWLLSIFYDEADEDLNGDGILQAEEDTDADGVLDVPNYLPGHSPARDDLEGRANALMSFYERETNTLIVRPMMPLRERTTYAVVVTRRILDEEGDPVGSPYPIVNHEGQTDALQSLLEVMPPGLTVSDIAFAFTFSTQTIETGWEAVREGLYGHGIQGHLGEEFPARLSSLENLRDPEASQFQGITRPQILPAEDWGKPGGPLSTLSQSSLLGDDSESTAYKIIQAHQSYIDYYVIGSFESPQLFERYDEEGRLLGLNDQVWPEDLATRSAAARSETVYFLLAIPRKEVSARGEGKPAPVVVLGHGYTGQRFGAYNFAPFFAKHGLATLAIDCVSHGISLNESEHDLAQLLLGSMGLQPFLDATLKDRAFDQDGDGISDTGADFWTGYMVHTRDVVRQSALDYMQLVRIVRSFDGERRWVFDVDGDGENELAGDFDADGHVDIGLGSTISMTGGSLGGIMTGVTASVEPEITVAVPIVGGGGLGDIANRSRQGGVREAVVLRALGPLFIGNLDAGSGDLEVRTIIPDLNDVENARLGTISGVSPGDTFVVRNLRSGEAGCGYVTLEGKVRAELPCDLGDPLEVTVYAGYALEPEPDCPLREDASAIGRVDAFEETLAFQGQLYEAGDPLVSLAEGLGKKRATPGLRRFLNLAQHVLDPADPAVLMEFMLRRPLTYSGTGQTTGAHVMNVTTLGDMNVPASGGVNQARSAGLIEFLIPDDRWGKTPNQLLIETAVFEAVHHLGRFHDTSGNPVHLDVENFSEGEDPHLDTIPRLEPPAHLWAEDLFCSDDPPYDKLPCGISGLALPLTNVTGQHGFDWPGAWQDKGLANCVAACTEAVTEDNADPCACEDLDVFDMGHFVFNSLGRYFASEGTEWDIRPCNGRDDCEDLPPPPPWRDEPDSEAYDPDAVR